MNAEKKHQLVTLDDLEQFKVEMLSSIERLLSFVKGPPVKRWVKAAEARKLIGVSPNKLYMIRKRGLLAFTKIGGNIYYDQEDLYRLFEDNKVGQQK